MGKQRTFRQDIRRKLIFFGLVPMLLISIVSSWLIYQSEESLMISEHTRLLRTVERLSSDYYQRIHLFFNIVRNRITQGEVSTIKDGFDFAPDFHSILVLDRNGSIEQAYCRHHYAEKKPELDPHQRNMIEPILRGEKSKRGSVYYAHNGKTILLTHAFVYQDKIYLISVNAEPFFSQLAYYIQRKNDRSISIINRKAIYIYNSRDPDLARKERLFTQESAYAAVVKHHHPYTVVEYPMHYQEGDSFWDGIFDEDNFLSYAHISDFEWIVTVHDHIDSIDDYLQKALVAVIVLLAVTMMLTMLSANLMARYIITPVERLIRSIDAFARNDRSVEQEKVITTYPIFENLANSFKSMRTQIIAREEKLKEKVDENIRMQDQLIQQEKHAAMGEMIGNIAHQWRQPLSVISTLATGLQAEQELGLATEDRISEVCVQINDNAQYLSGTIDDFRQFIKGEHVKVDFKASDLIESLESLMRGSLRRHEIHVDIFAEEGLMIHGYRNDLLQVLINLISNAKDALLENRDKNRLVRIAVRSGNEGHVQIRVLDNGGGIKKEIIARIFEPYFTTKHKSQGTGLGLHMVHRLIVEGMGGQIDVRTLSFSYRENTCLGAEFTITLPAGSTEISIGEHDESV